MYLFILESIGTQELILVGLVALIVFGPRKLPEMARKLGSMMSEFRKVSGDFRSTWENAVSLEDLDKPKNIEKKVTQKRQLETENSIGQQDLRVEKINTNGKSSKPEIRNVSKEEFDQLVSNKTKDDLKAAPVKTKEPTQQEKTDWL